MSDTDSVCTYYSSSSSCRDLEEEEPFYVQDGYEEEYEYYENRNKQIEQPEIVERPVPPVKIDWNAPNPWKTMTDDPVASNAGKSMLDIMREEEVISRLEKEKLEKEKRFKNRPNFNFSNKNYNNNGRPRAFSRNSRNRNSTSSENSASGEGAWSRNRSDSNRNSSGNYKNYTRSNNRQNNTSQNTGQQRTSLLKSIKK